MLRALETVGLSSDPECQRAADWLRSVQNPDGGFGESILSYYDPALKGKGQEHRFADGVGADRIACNGWSGRSRRPNARLRGLSRTRTKTARGTKTEFTGTGFPCVFYLKYHLYRNSFPLYALARFDNMRKGRRKSFALQIPAEEIKHLIGDGGNG